MEDYFNPGFKTKPAILVGSQTLIFFHGNPEEQAWEGVHLAGASKDDVAVVRNIDPDYIKYWSSLMENPQIINLTNTNSADYLTQAIMDDKEAMDLIRQKMNPNAKLMVFFPTNLEQKLAKELNVPLHGSPAISSDYGTKSGIRRLAEDTGISMAPGYVCSTFEQIREAVKILGKNFESVVIKHDFSVSGYFSKRLLVTEVHDLQVHLNELIGREFIDLNEIVVVEGWLKSKTSLCAQIEIVEGKEPIICAGWQQIIAPDGISYLGGGPLMLSTKAFKSFYEQVYKLAQALKKKGAIGSYGPDFLITDEDEINVEPDTCFLIELNARVPYTAFPLEIIKQIKGTIGTGFFAKHIKLKTATTYKQIEDQLRTEGLLVTKKDSRSSGVVPYNVGLLPWGIFDIAVMADSWEETTLIVKKVNEIFKQDLTL